MSIKNEKIELNQEREKKILKLIGEFKIKNRRFLTKEEMRKILDSNGVSKLSFRLRRNIKDVANRGLNFEELEKAFPDKKEHLSEEEKDFLRISFYSSFEELTSNFMFICQEELLDSARMSEVLKEIQPKLKRLYHFMYDRSVIVDTDFYDFWYHEHPMEVKKENCIQKRK